MRPLVWFRNDLRTCDNPALSSAMSRAEGRVVAVFLVSRSQWDEHDWGEAKVDFVLRNVDALRGALADHGVVLHTLEVPRFKDAPAALLKLAREQRCDTLCFNREYEVNELARDARATDAFAQGSLAVESHDDQTVLPPNLLRTGSGQFYRVFTPFKNAWIEAVKARLPLRLDKLKGAGGLRAAEAPTRGRWADLWPAGEFEAQRRLKKFIRERITRYRDDRDFPALEGTSALSPYLSAGVISARQCLLAAMEANDGMLEGGEPGVTTWIGELIWREFYRHVLVGFPRVCKHQPFRLDTTRIKWRDDDAGFTAWREGRTGVPIVDAAMRQLAATGWMHNRLRMIAAMYLTKNLFIDWRRGERFFMRHLVDADLAQNNGGWQWSASTGTDAAPYFRMFNPISQSRRFDPSGACIRRYVPELSELNDDAIHDPGNLPPLIRAGLDYPMPLVEQAWSRCRVMEAFGALK